jgi:hypothetical protein
MTDVANFRPHIDSDSALMGQVLNVYKPNCRYLKHVLLRAEGIKAAGEYFGSEGQFSIPESCYIDDTGHFNSVEFNICYNQLVYYTIAKAVKEGASSFFDAWTLEVFWQKQLPDILIVDFKSKFKRPINSRSFKGALEFTRATRVLDFMHLTTQIRFWDESSGFSEGTVSLAIVKTPKQTKMEKQ